MCTPRSANWELINRNLLAAMGLLPASTRNEQFHQLKSLLIPYSLTNYDDYRVSIPPLKKNCILYKLACSLIGQSNHQL